MKGSALALIMLAFANRFTILALLSLILISPLNNAQQEEINAWEVDGGHSVIMEQYTATWCDICASVDSWIPDFTEANGNRVIRVAIHDDFEDPLGTPITDYRLERYTDSPVAPSFWFDGVILAGGAPDMSTLHRNLLSAENQRRGDTDLNLRITHESGQLIISSTLSDWNDEENTKISFLILENIVEIPSNLATNGMNKHHDVLFAYSEIYLNNSSNWAYPDTSWSDISLQNNSISSKFNIPSDKSLDNLQVVVIHEYLEVNDQGPNTLGAASIYLGTSEENSKFSIIFPVMLILLISILPLIIRFQK